MTLMNSIRILLIFLCFGILATYGQGPKISLGQLITSIDSNSGYHVIYSPSKIDTTQELPMSSKELSLDELATELSEKYQIEARVQGNRIVLYRSANPKHTLSGYIMDKATGEVLIGASMYCQENQMGTVSNHYGFYSLTLPEGNHQVICSYIGYQAETLEVDLKTSQRQDVNLMPKSTALGPVIITASDEDQSITKRKMGAHYIDSRAIESAPILLGEPDAIKTIQTLPGVKTVGEGSSNFFVRGGGLDQNLILLDEAPVYNPAHALGFFSVFNTDAIKKIEVFKGDIPAYEGGRLASLVDIRTKDGNNQKFGMAGGLSPIAAKLTVEAPIVKGKSSFILSGRRSFFDIFYGLASDEANVSFYDLNGKINTKLGKKDKLFFSFYQGKDFFQLNPSYSVNWGNNTATLRWNHIYSNKLFSTLSLVTSDYNYQIDIPLNEADDIKWQSGIQDYNAKLKFTHYLSPKVTLFYGANAIIHEFTPGAKAFEDGLTEYENAMFSAMRYSHQNWELSLGLRYSQAVLVGPFTHIVLDKDYETTGSVNYTKNEPVTEYGGLEPRLSASYVLSNLWKVSLSANRTRQYLQLLSNATGGFTSFDLWFLASINTQPQISDQLALGFKTPERKKCIFSVEAYYKLMQNQLDYIDHAQIIENQFLEESLRQGDGKSYGVEFAASYSKGKAHVNLSYSYSRTLRKIEDINNGEWYPATFDRPHDLKLQGQLSNIGRWNLMANFSFASGRAATLPVGFYQFENRSIPVYSGRNEARLPAFHRLDIAAKYHPKNKKGHRWKGEWIFSVMNVYNQHNTFSINFGRAVASDGRIVDPKFDHVRSNAVSHTYLLGVLPSISYNFRF